LKSNKITPRSAQLREDFKCCIQCFGSAFDGFLDPDPEGENQPLKRRKIKSEDQKKL
jgi:hypothetical protein